MKNLFALVAALGISVAMVGCGEPTVENKPADKTTPADTATTPPADTATTPPTDTTTPPAEAPKDEKKE